MSFPDPLDVIATILILLNGVFGVFCNFSVVFIFFKFPLERTSFHLICVYRAMVNLVILTWAFLGTFVPITLFGDSLFPPLYQTIVITCSNGIYAGLQYCGFIIAANRFCAMYFPKLYFKLFSLKVTFIVMTAVVAIRVVNAILDFHFMIPNSCFSTFSAQNLSWQPDPDPKCSPVPISIVDASAVLVLILIAMNLATFWKICKFYNSRNIGEKETKRKMRKNKMMFLQTVIQDLIYLLDMVFTFLLSNLITERYWTFISRSFIWESVHSFDGLIMIMFNERLSFLKKRLFPSTNKDPVDHNCNQNQDMRIKMQMTRSIAPSRTPNIFITENCAH